MQSNRKAPVIIRDIVVAAKKAETSPAGEFSDPVQFDGPAVPPLETPTQLINRVYNHIQKLVSYIANEHRQSNCTAEHHNQLKPGKENAITRMITNEFFFYTQKPLTLDQFQELQQKIMHLAADQPENLHLIVGSFAVKTPDDSVMNIVPQIQCGPNPKINLIVKNHPSSIDPVYREEDKSSGTLVEKPLRRVKIEYDDISTLKIAINGEQHFFSYNNVIQCDTTAGGSFYSCIDICRDHALGIAKLNLSSVLNKTLSTTIAKATPGQQTQSIPIQCSHVVVSNSVSLDHTNCLGIVTHADPIYTYADAGCKQGVKAEQPQTFENTTQQPSEFGSPGHIIDTAPTPADPLPKDKLRLVETYNEGLRDFIATFSGSRDTLARELAAFVNTLIATKVFSKQDINDLVYAAAENNNMAIIVALQNEKLITKQQVMQMALQAANISNSTVLNTLIQLPDIASGDTIAHTAVEMGKIDLLRLLIKAGADVNKTNQLDKTPAHLVAEKSDIDIHESLAILSELQTAGADLDKQDKSNKSPKDLFKERIMTQCKPSKPGMFAGSELKSLLSKLDKVTNKQTQQATFHAQDTTTSPSTTMKSGGR